ncbi:MAG: hypothetical protein JWN54_2678 [Mycobacterium sp.]|nr:hypothetical protein [Mycobacterium sp.]
MRSLHPLRALDERVLPRLARGLNRLLGRSVPAAEGGAETETEPGSDTSPPAGPAPAGGGRRGRVLGALAVLGVVAVVGSAVLVSRDVPPPDDTVGDVVRVGAAEGDRVASYADRARAELGALVANSTAETYALVSLRGYGTPAAVLPLLTDVEPARVFVRLPLPQVQTAIESFGVRTPAVDIPVALRRIAAEREAGAARDEQTAARLSGDDAKERQLRAFYTDSARLDRAEAAAYRQGCACVYALVVRATPVRLVELARRAGVRVVDPAPEIRRLDRTVFLPLLPEQAAVVTPPPDRSLPTEPIDPPGG